jgi:hypothetical protein
MILTRARDRRRAPWADRRLQDDVEQPDDRRGVDRIFVDLVRGEGFLRGRQILVIIVVGLIVERAVFVGAFAVKLLDRGVDLPRRSDHRFDLAVGRELKVVNRQQVVRIGEGHGQDTVGQLHRHDAVGLGLLRFQLGQRRLLGIVLVEIDDVVALLPGQRQRQGVLVNQLKLDEDLADGIALFTLYLQRLLDVALRDELHLLEDLPQRLLVCHRASLLRSVNPRTGVRGHHVAWLRRGCIGWGIINAEGVRRRPPRR